ncbi:MAG: hypothetical protein IAF38_15555 [Bacteroidia bacterium]|nr:hypothetical protein [Bacteroidia bacterium]
MPNLDEEMKLKEIIKQYGLFFLIGFLLSGIAFSQTKNVSAISAFDSLFKEIKFDTLQVCPAHLVLSSGKKGSGEPRRTTDSLGVNGKIISPETAKKLILPFEKEKFYAVARFYLDQQKKINAYLVRQAGASGIRMFVYYSDSAKFILETEVSFYSYLPGTMSETLNTWITDVNKDKVLDIAIMKYIHDFELANKYAPNITGEERHIYFFKKGKFEFARWENEVLPDVVLKK